MCFIKLLIMKRVLYLFTLCLFASFVFAGQGFESTYQQPETGIHQVNFNLDEYDISTVVHDGTTFATILFEGSVSTTRQGFAELPYIHASLMLPADRNVTLNIVEEDYEEFILTEPLLPSRGVIYRDQDPSTVPYVIHPSSLRDEWYPQDLASMTDPFIVRDIRGTTVYVYPFRYNAVQNVLRVYTSLTVELKEVNTAPINPLAKNAETVLREMDPVYRSLFINYPQESKDLTIGDFGDILVLCTSRDEDVMEPYVEWKMQKGFNVSTQTVAVGTNVKTIIQDAYDANNNLLYVQLVGDWADIKSDLLSGYAPMDPQLGCVVGTDEYSDICIGRFSANSADEVAVQVAKVIAYEKEPEAGADWYTSALGVASNEGPGDDNEMDYEHVDVIHNDKLDPSTFESFTAVYDPSGSAQMVTNAVNSGVSIINYTGHGSNTSWGSSGFSNSHISGLTNENRLPIVFSVACVNGAFHSSGGDCFAEAWLEKENGGAVLTMMATINQPWNPPMRGQDYFNDLLIGGYDYSAHPGQSGISTTEGRTTIGAITFNSFVLMCTESGSNSDWETAKTWHLFGDPSMQPRTSPPGDLTLSSTVVLVGAPFTTTISGPDGPVEGALLCLSQGDVYTSAVSDASGIVTFDHELTPGAAQLVVTAFNMETIFEEITVIPPGGPYVVVNSSGVDDLNGNNNGQADYGETVLLDVMAENVGTEDATDVTAVLVSMDPYITVLDDNFTFGTIAAGAIVEGMGAFEIEVATDVPDGHTAMMEVEFNDLSESSWVSNMMVTLHAPVMNVAGYTIEDPSGNNNGKIDPGEEVNIVLEIGNDGSSDAYEVMAEITCTDPYITIQQGTQSYGDITAGSSGMQTFVVSAAANTPAGHLVTFDVAVSGALDLNASGSFEEVVGQIPVLIIDMDGNANSADKMMEALAANDMVAEYMQDFPEDLNLYTSVFLCLGIYSDNYVLSSGEGQALADYLNNGGNLYMEGGDTWYYDTQTAVHAMFSVNATSDGGSDLSTVGGMAGTFTEGMSFNYSGDNSWIDHIEASGDAIDVLENQSPVYTTAVANDAGTYKTIASSHEFGGLDDAGSPSSKEELMTAYLEFFGFNSALTALFTSDNIEICENEVVEFYDVSTGGVVTWDWTFEGGQPGTSSFQNPMVMYSEAGTYDVTLTVSDGVDSHSVTIEDYITVNVCTGTEEQTFEKISVQPNPNNGIFTVEFSNVLRNIATIKVFNTLSTMVYKEENVTIDGSFSTTIDLSNLDKGLYFLVIENYQGSTVHRIIIR
jgi:PKD repeat protein